MTWKQSDIDLVILMIREGGRVRDIASMFSIIPDAIYALVRSRNFNIKKLKKMPPLPLKKRKRIIQEFCKNEAKQEALCSVLQRYCINFEDFVSQHFLNLLKDPRILKKQYALATKTGKCVTPGMSERNREIAELRRHGMTLAEIGLRYGITRERVRGIVLQFNEVSDNPVDIVKARVRRCRTSPEALERRNKIAELYQTGLTDRQIANTLGIARQTVLYNIARYNETAERPLVLCKTDRRKVTDEINDAIIQEYKKNRKTHYALAQQFGLSCGTIGRILKKAGLCRRHTPRSAKKSNRSADKF
jgi:transposase